MSLLTLHKALIGLAAAFFLFFGISELLRAGEGQSIVIAVVCLGLAVGAVIYLMWVIRGGYTWKKK